MTQQTKKKLLYYLGIGAVALLALFMLIHISSITVTQWDEYNMIKDPLKVLYSYYSGSIPDVKMTLFYWLIVVYDSVLFIIGKFFGLWPSSNEYIIRLGCGDLFPFPARFINIILGTINIAVVAFIFHKLTKTFFSFSIATNRLLALLFTGLMLLHPVYLNIQGVLKFDIFSFLFYNLFFFFLLMYQITNKFRFLTLLSIVTWLGLATRVEFALFALVYFIFIALKFFVQGTPANRKNLLKVIIKSNVLGMALYFAIIWLPIVITQILFYRPDAKPLTHLIDFSKSHTRLLTLENFKFLLNQFVNFELKAFVLMNLLLLSSIIFSLIGLKRELKPPLQLHPRLIITSLANNYEFIALFIMLIAYLSIMFIHVRSAFRYQLLPSVLLVWLFIAVIIALQRREKTKLVKLGLFLGFLQMGLYLIYAFGLYKVANIHVKHDIDKQFWQYISSNIETGDTVLINMIAYQSMPCDFKICPSQLNRQIQEIQAKGKGTGRILQYRLSNVINDSSNCANIYIIHFSKESNDSQNKLLISTVDEVFSLNPELIYISLYESFEDSVRIAHNVEFPEFVKAIEQNGYQVVKSFTIDPEQLLIYPWCNEWILSKYFIWQRRVKSNSFTEQ